MYGLATPSIGRMKSDREQDGLHGPVRSLRLELDRVSKVAGLFAVKRRVLVRFACYDADGRKTEEVNYNSGGSEEQRELYSYDVAQHELQLLRQEDLTEALAEGTALGSALREACVCVLLGAVRG